MTIGAIVRRAVASLEAAGLDPGDADFDATLLARHVLGWDAAAWLIRQREAPPPDFDAAFDALVQRRRRREPAAYIIGRREFYGRNFSVTRDVLIPRPETEHLVDATLEAIDTLRAAGVGRIRIADVGTGSGCLAVTIALERDDVEIVATDVSPAALAVAAGNARNLGTADRITWKHAPLVEDSADSIDIVVANPPYVSEADRHSLQADVRDYEPAVALFGGADGLSVIRELVPSAARALVPGGWLLMEIGAGQDAAVRDVVLESASFTEPRILPDLAGIPRVVVAVKRAGSV